MSDLVKRLRAYSGRTIHKEAADRIDSDAKRIAELEEQVHTKISEDVKAFLRHDTIKKQTQRIAELEAQLADMKYELISEARLDAIEQYGVDLEFSGIDIHHRIGKKLQAMVKGEES